MVNPGVITLATLNGIESLNFPYRFCVEDNIGEAIHIHYKDMRLDLTTEQFKNAANEIEKALNRIVDVEGFKASDFDPVFLVGISPYLADLTRIEKREVFLEDILVDTFDEEGNAVHRNIKYSRVFKALCGLKDENDSYKMQFNHYKAGASEKLSNHERILWNLEQVKKNGYPSDDNLISIDSENKIIDGQHRAACLYYLYGNIKVPVRTLVFEGRADPLRLDSDWQKFERELYERALRDNADKVLFQVYFDNGNGFSEDNSIRIGYDPQPENEVEISFQIPDGTRHIRIDPADKPCCITLKELVLSKADGNEVAYDIHKLSSNAFYQNDAEYVFVTNDSQFYLVGDGVLSISIKFFYAECNIYNKNKMEELNIKITELTARCATMLAEKNALYNSRSWQITKPLRLVKRAKKYASKNGILKTIKHSILFVFKK